MSEIHLVTFLPYLIYYSTTYKRKYMINDNKYEGVKRSKTFKWTLNDDLLPINNLKDKIICCPILF